MKQNDFIITTDSGCDMNYEMCKKYNVIPLFMNYMEGDQSFTDHMDDEETKVFYDKMRKGALYKTSSINVEEAYKFFEKLLIEEKPIVHISLGSAISATYNNCVIAANLLKEKYSGSEIYVVDSTVASAAYAILAIKATELRSEGFTAKETAERIELIKYSVNTFYTTNTLTYLARGGRVSKGTSIFGNILSIKPILGLDKKGHLVIYKKAHGMNNAIQQIANYIGETVINPQNQTLYVTHGDCLESAVKYAEMIKERYNFKDINYSYIGSIIGSHAGPGLIAFFFMGKDRTE